MATTSIVFCLWLMIHEIVHMQMCYIQLEQCHEEDFSFTMININDRKFTSGGNGKTYALCNFEDEENICAFTHSNNCIKAYKNMMGRELLMGYPVLPREDEALKRIQFGEIMVQSTFMKTISHTVR